MDWKDYWTTYPKKFAKTEFSRQVQYTVAGLPLPDAKARESVMSLCASLDLQPDDDLLELCCGNGRVTKHLAEKCRTVLGVDFSPTLIGVAAEFHSGENISYICQDVMDFLHSTDHSDRRFSKILLHGSLHYFEVRDLPRLIFGMCNVLTGPGIILLGAVPDRARKYAFYNTTTRRIRHLFNRCLGRDRLGTWWDAGMIERVCRDHDLKCQFIESAGNVGAPYRFDVKIVRSHPALTNMSSSKTVSDG